MIPAARRGWFTAWFARQVRRRLHATFGTIEIAGLSHLRDAATGGSVIVVANHTSWWDGMMLIELGVMQTGLESYTMMDANNLRQLRFFALLGAFGVDLESRRDGVRALRYGAGLLDRPGRVLWLFPQGAERPSHEPLRFRSGAARMATLAQATVVPMGLRYVFAAEPKPRALVSFGAPLANTDDTRDSVRMQQAGVAQELARIDSHVSAEDPAFEVVHRSPYAGASGLLTAMLDRMAGALLGPSNPEPVALVEPERSLAPGPSTRESEP